MDVDSGPDEIGEPHSVEMITSKMYTCEENQAIALENSLRQVDKCSATAIIPGKDGQCRVIGQKSKQRQEYDRTVLKEQTCTVLRRVMIVIVAKSVEERENIISRALVSNDMPHTPVTEWWR